MRFFLFFFKTTFFLEVLASALKLVEYFPMVMVV